MRRNEAIAKVYGGRSHPLIYGKVFFRQTVSGVMITAQIYNLPRQNSNDFGVFGFHIHEGGSCSGTSEDEFANAKAHFNPQGEQHPYHAGDLPPLFANEGYAFMQVLTDRFTVCDIIGKTIIIHSMPDDFETQPSGNSGDKIACGKIEKVC